MANDKTGKCKSEWLRDHSLISQSDYSLFISHVSWLSDNSNGHLDRVETASLADFRSFPILLSKHFLPTLPDEKNTDAGNEMHHFQIMVRITAYASNFQLYWQVPQRRTVLSLGWHAWNKSMQSTEFHYTKVFEGNFLTKLSITSLLEVHSFPNTPTLA